MLESIRKFKYIGIHIGELYNDFDFKIIPTESIATLEEIGNKQAGVSFAYHDSNGGNVLQNPAFIFGAIVFETANTIFIKNAYSNGAGIKTSSFLKIRKIYGILRI